MALVVNSAENPLLAPSAQAAGDLLQEGQDQLDDLDESTETRICSERIEKAIAILAAERERTGNAISNTSVERVAEARKLDASELIVLTKQCQEIGLFDEDEDVADDPHESATDEAEKPDDPGRQVSALMTNHALLTAVEEVQLGRSVRRGIELREALAQGTVNPSPETDDILSRARKAESVLILHNIRLALSVAYNYLGRGLELDDLLQEGIIGLMRAVTMFDHRLGFRFTTYATWWIRQSITRALANSGRAIRLPVHVAESLSRLRKIVRRLQNRNNGVAPKIAEIAAEIGWPNDRVGKYLVIEAEKFLALDSDDDRDAVPLLDRLHSNDPHPEDHMLALDLERTLSTCMAQLDDRSRRILKLRFGLGGESDGKTLEEVGATFNLTRERIRQVQDKSLGRLLKKHHETLSDFLES